MLPYAAGDAGESVCGGGVPGGWSPIAMILGHRCCIPASNAGLFWHGPWGLVIVTFATRASLEDHRLLPLPPQLPGEGCDPWAGAVWGCPANLLPVSLSGHHSPSVPSCGTGAACPLHPVGLVGTPGPAPGFCLSRCWDTVLGLGGDVGAAHYCGGVGVGGTNLGGDTHNGTSASPAGMPSARLSPRGAF